MATPTTYTNFKLMFQQAGCPQFNFRQYLFGVQGELGVKHPRVVTGLLFQHLFHGYAFILTEAEYLHPVGVVDDESGEVDGIVLVGEFTQEVDIVLERIAVAVELRLKHLVSRHGVGGSRVGILQVFVAVEAIGSTERALFHLVEDGLHVDELALTHVEINLCPQEFLGEQGDVKAVGIITAEVAALHVAGQFPGDVLERGTILHVIIMDAVNGGGLLRNVHPGIEAAGPLLLLAVGEHLEEGDFHDTVLGYVHSRCFQVEENNRVLQL